MIGQTALKSQIIEMIRRNTFPSFSIICGPEGSGKHTLCKFISEQMNEEMFIFDNSMSSIDIFMDTAYNQTRPVIYLLQDMDLANIKVKNAILKITEEPVKYSTIILLCINKMSLPETLLSRAHVFEISPYSKEELKEYICSSNKECLDIDTTLSVCNYIGDVDKALKINVKGLIEYSNSIIHNMSKATIASALKIVNKLNISEEDDKYDIILFLNCLNMCLVEEAKRCTQRILLDRYIEASNLIEQVKGYLGIKALNKSFTMDEFIIKLYNILGVN